MRDRILAFIERTASRIHSWAWDKRWKERDPNEWTNLAGQPQHAGLKKELAKWFPKKNAPGAAAFKAKRQPKKK